MRRRMTKRNRGAAGWALLLVAGILAGCAQTNEAPVESRGGFGSSTQTVNPATLPGAENAGKPGYYTVKPGDTLIRIGLEHGQSWKDIARCRQRAAVRRHRWRLRRPPQHRPLPRPHRIAMPVAKALSGPHRAPWSRASTKAPTKAWALPARRATLWWLQPTARWCTQALVRVAMAISSS